MAIIWALGAAAVVGVRYRGTSESYVAIHRWLSVNGVPEAVRNFDQLFWFTIAAFIGALIVKSATRRPVAELLCLQRGSRGWF
jgi:hypothetical protein